MVEAVLEDTQSGKVRLEGEGNSMKLRKKYSKNVTQTPTQLCSTFSKV